MAFEGNMLVVTMTAATAFVAADQYKPVRISAAKTVGLCDTAGQDVYGVLLEETASLGDSVRVCVWGETKMRAGAAISAGARVKALATGKFGTAVAGRTDTSDSGAAVDALLGSYVCGIAVNAAAADVDVFTGFFCQIGAIPTTAA